MYVLIPIPVASIQLKKSGSYTPRVELEEMGPSMELVLRRVHLAAHDLFRLACKKPKQLKVSSKNIGRHNGREVFTMHV